MATRNRTVSDHADDRGLGRVLLDTLTEAVLTVSLFFLRFIGWGIRWTAALIIFVLVMAASGFFVFAGALEGGAPVEVPNVIGLPITEADFILEGKGLEMGKQERVNHDTVPQYHIIAQRPQPGRTVRTGRKVSTVVSMGPNYRAVPSLLRKPLSEARTLLASGRFDEGTIARIPHDTPRDTVIAQDPPPGQAVSADGQLHLLVSGGLSGNSAYMPDLRGRRVEELPGLLRDQNVRLVPQIVDFADAATDVVLNQDPPPDTLIYDGQVVKYQVRPSGQTEIPGRYTTTFIHQFGSDWYDRDVRVEVIFRDGSREVLFTKPPLYDDDAKRTYIKANGMQIKVSYVEEATVEIWVNGTRTEWYTVRDGGEPTASGGG